MIVVVRRRLLAATTPALLFCAAIASGAAFGQGYGPPPAARTNNVAQEPLQPAAYPIAPERLAAVAEELRRRYPAPSPVRVSVDLRNSQLLVIAPADVHKDLITWLGPREQVRDRAEASGEPRLPHSAQRPVEQPPDLAPRNPEPRRDSTPGLNAPRATPSSPATPSPLQQSPSSSGPRTYSLRHIKFPELEQLLRRTWPTQLQFKPSSDGHRLLVELPDDRRVLDIDRRDNVVRFEGPDEAARIWRTLVTTLDRPRRTPREHTEIAALENAAPATVQTAMTLLKQAAAMHAPRGKANGDATATRRAENMVALIFQAPENQPEQPPPAEPPDEVPPRPDLEDDEELEPGEIGDVQLEFVPEFGIVVVRGRQRDVARVMRIIDEIIAHALETQPAVEVVPLEHINSQAASVLVAQLYADAFAARQPPVSIVSLDKPNALVLVGRAEAVASVKEILDKLDQPVPPATQMKIFRLKFMSAIDAETTVRRFFTNLPGQGTGTETENLRPGLGTRLRTIADYRTNALIIQASPRDLEEVSFLLDRLDVEGTESTHILRIFKLRNTLAPDMAGVLQQAISGLPQVPLGGPQETITATTGPTQPGVTLRSTNVSIVGVDTAGNRLIESGILADVTVTADPNVNAIIVRGPAHSMELMAALIAQLDQLPDAEAQIKVFQLENGDARAMLATLQQLFGQQVTVGQPAFTQALALATGALGTGESALIPLRFTFDMRTNSIIASGSASDLAVVELLILRLDESGIEQRVTRVIRLKNAPALDVATAISNFLAAQQQITGFMATVTGEISIGEQIDREVIVVPELVTNSLIISASPRFYDDIMKVINDLDFRPAMIMVQVLIAEVELNDIFEFGVELGLQDSILFDRGIGALQGVFPQSVPGFNFNQVATPNENSFARSSLAGRGVTGFGVGAGGAGLALTAASESINILVRALQDADRLQILSRPQIMTLDNEPAFVQVGARVPRITGSAIQQFGGISNTVQDVDVGLLLRIQPRVNEEGVVVMTLDAERSFVGPAAQGVPVAVTPDGQAVNAPPIITTTAQTTLSARSGQTIVFGGLIAKEKEINSRRVPYLADIPVLGRLFRFDSERERRTELLIIMTPHIVDDDHKVEWLNRTESDRMSWCLADVIEMHGYAETLSGGHGLWGPLGAPVIYPDLHPTADLLPKGLIIEAEPLETPRRLSPPPIIPQPPLQPAVPPTTPQTPSQATPPDLTPPESSRRTPQRSAAQATYFSHHPEPMVEPAHYRPERLGPPPMRLPALR